MSWKSFTTLMTGLVYKHTHPWRHRHACSKLVKRQSVPYMYSELWKAIYRVEIWPEINFVNLGPNSGVKIGVNVTKWSLSERNPCLNSLTTNVENRINLFGRLSTRSSLTRNFEAEIILSCVKMTTPLLLAEKFLRFLMTISQVLPAILVHLSILRFEIPTAIKTDLFNFILWPPLISKKNKDVKYSELYRVW